MFYTGPSQLARPPSPGPFLDFGFQYTNQPVKKDWGRILDLDWLNFAWRPCYIIYSRVSLGVPGGFPEGFLMILILKLIYSKKATTFCEIFPLLLTICTVVKSKGKISKKNYGLLRMYELYK